MYESRREAVKGSVPWDQGRPKPFRGSTQDVHLKTLYRNSLQTKRRKGKVKNLRAIQSILGMMG